MIKLVTSIAGLLAFSSMAWATDIDLNTSAGNPGKGGATIDATVEDRNVEATVGKDGAGLSVSVQGGTINGDPTVGGSAAANPNN